MFPFAHLGREVTVPKIFLAKLRLFESRPDLAARGRYTITSDVDREVVDLFFARVLGDQAEVVTADNAEKFRALCDELGFAGFEDEIRALLGGDSKVRRDLVGLQGRVDRHDVIIKELQRRVCALQRELQFQSGVPERVEAVERRVEANRSDVEGAVADARREAVDLRKDVARLRSTVGEQVNKMSRLDVIPSIEARLNEVVRAVREEFPKRFRAVEANLGDARREAGALREDVALRRSERASGADVAALSKEAARLKEAEAKPSLRASEFHYSGRPLDGIIAHLTSVCGGNVHEKGIIEVTASSCFSPKTQGRVVDLETDSSFSSRDEPNSWICYDFKGRRVAPTSYSIRTHSGDGFPKSWVLEVSNDGGEGSWEVVDRRNDNQDLTDRYVTHNFQISAPTSRSFRFVRLRQTGKSHSGYYFLNINSFEVFGTLAEP